jgi:hypothetical protein
MSIGRESELVGGINQRACSYYGGEAGACLVRFPPKPHGYLYLYRYNTVFGLY